MKIQIVDSKILLDGRCLSVISEVLANEDLIMICDAGGSNANEDLELTQELESSSTFDYNNKGGGEM